MKNFPDDQDYIFRIIDYLFEKYGISFFITSKDFDVLYNWWEKKIPEGLIRNSIDSVYKKRIAKGRKIDSFMNFSYEVKKNLVAKFDVNVNYESSGIENRNKDKSKMFYENFPVGLKKLENKFKLLRDAPEPKRAILLEDIYEKLIIMYLNDEEMNIKTEIFMSNLPDAMKKPEILKKFRINFLCRRFNIPDFD